MSSLQRCRSSVSLSLSLCGSDLLPSQPGLSSLLPWSECLCSAHQDCGSFVQVCAHCVQLALDQLLHVTAAPKSPLATLEVSQMLQFVEPHPQESAWPAAGGFLRTVGRGSCNCPCCGWQYVLRAHRSNRWSLLSLPPLRAPLIHLPTLLHALHSDPLFPVLTPFQLHFSLFDNSLKILKGWARLSFF